MLLFVPNLSKQKDAVQSKGDAAVVKVVESQIELYEINEGRTPSISELTSAGYITEKQAETYHAAKADCYMPFKRQNDKIKFE